MKSELGWIDSLRVGDKYHLKFRLASLLNFLSTANLFKNTIP